MWIAYVVLNTLEGPEVVVSVGIDKWAAETGIPEVLDKKGYSSAQIGKMLDRVVVRKMTPHPAALHAFTEVVLVQKKERG